MDIIVTTFSLFIGLVPGTASDYIREEIDILAAAAKAEKAAIAS
jgi:hypothetical protein